MISDPFLKELNDDLCDLEARLKANGAAYSMQARAGDARNAILWLQEVLDKKGKS